MADDAPKVPSPFDVRTIKYLVALMSRHDLSEIDLREGDLRIRLRRGPQGTPVVTTVAPVGLPAPPARAPGETPFVLDKEQSKPEQTQIPIKSPTPGTFYAAPDAGAEPFVKVGSRVAPNTVVCIIEAMKIFNEIQAECTGVIVEINVENQQPVEFGQVLFKVDPTA